MSYHLFCLAFAPNTSLRGESRIQVLQITKESAVHHVRAQNKYCTIGDSAKAQAESQMGKTTRNLTVVLVLFWTLTILYREMFAFWLPSLLTCSWPHLSRQSSSSSSSSSNAAEYKDDYVKVAVIADPQMMDRTSLHLPTKFLALEIAHFYTDLYMRRAVLSSILPFKPGVILFMRDYFDGGSFLSDEEWQESLDRFKHVFDLSTLQSRGTEIYYVPGNHDIGYVAQHPFWPQVIKRYEENFHSRSY